MRRFPPPETLGPRIMVLGPTNSGKSTLAEALGRRLALPVIHLDQLRHRPDTDWQPRPDGEFVKLHDAAISTPQWIIDGSYSIVMRQRLERTTGIVVLDAPLFIRTARYFKRSLFEQHRSGGLGRAHERVTFEMLAWLWKTRHKAEDTRQRVRASGLPHVFCHNRRELAELYRQWSLQRQRTGQ